MSTSPDPPEIASATTGFPAQSLLDCLPDAILSLERSGRILALNEAAIRRVGGEAGQAIVEILSPEVREPFCRFLGEVFEQGEPREFDCRWDIHAAEEERRDPAWCVCRLVPIRRNGHVGEVWLILTDITPRRQREQTLQAELFELQRQVHEQTEALKRRTAELTAEIAERRKAEAELHERERFLSHLAEAAPYLLYVFDVGERRNIYVNSQMHKLLGYPPQQIQAMGGELIGRLIHPDDHAVIEEYLTRIDAAADGQVVVVDYRMRHQSGPWRWFRSHNVVFERNPDGSVRRILGTARDVTSERDAERELRSSEQRLRLMADALPALIGYIGADQRYKFNNARYQEWFGTESRDLRGRLVQDVLGDSFETFRPYIEQALSGKRVSADAPLRWPDGSTRQIHVEWVPDIDSDGQVAGYYVLVSDISERRRQEEILRRTERLASIGTLAAGLAHEINNPLAAIYNAASAALRQEQSAPLEGRVHECLELIRSETDRIKRIVKSVQQFARDGVLERRPHRVAELVQIAIERTAAEAESRCVTVRCESPAGLRPIPLDGMKIESVFINLIANAIQASRPGSEVVVRVSSHFDRQEIAVEDHGHGIDEADLPRIFDPFYSTREQEGGTGLGLSIAHGIIEHHGGKLNVQSERSKGTTITVVLPYLTLPIE